MSCRRTDSHRMSSFVNSQVHVSRPRSRIQDFSRPRIQVLVSTCNVLLFQVAKKQLRLIFKWRAQFVVHITRKRSPRQSWCNVDLILSGWKWVNSLSLSLPTSFNSIT
eukprot:scaffold1727_cov133-Cylindrotheca_fusiformis.AAC.58